MPEEEPSPYLNRSPEEKSDKERTFDDLEHQLRITDRDMNKALQFHWPKWPSRCLDQFEKIYFRMPEKWDKLQIFIKENDLSEPDPRDGHFTHLLTENYGLRGKAAEFKRAIKQADWELARNLLHDIHDIFGQIDEDYKKREGVKESTPVKPEADNTADEEPEKPSL